MSATEPRNAVTSHRAAGIPARGETTWHSHSAAAGFVAELDGPRLDQPLSASELDALHGYYAATPVLILPDQYLDRAAFERFAAQVGEFGPNPYLGTIEEGGNIVEVRREADETTPIFGASWHSDWSFLATPPGATLLHAKIVPPTGGDTCFADGYRAYETLSPALRDRIVGLRAIHTAAPSYGPNGLFAKDDASRSMQIVVSPGAERTQSHPVVRTHPQTGRQSLFINPAYTVAIENMAPGSGRALLQTLFRHMTAGDLVYRHRWRHNTLIIWDNRCVMHFADGGYEGHRRVMHRITLAGEPPQ
jgi:taurine dioxygenase